MIMKIIWDSQEAPALQQIMDRVNEENGKNWKSQTVSTFLSRLVKKGFLTSQRRGRYSYYQPLVSKEEFWQATMEENAEFFAQGDMVEMAYRLCRKMLSREEREKLKEKLE